MHVLAGFRVGWEGVDQSGNRVRRVDEKVMAAVNVKVEIRVQGNGSFDVFAGTSLTVTVNITNVGNTSTWHVRVQDTSAFYNGSSEIRYSAHFFFYRPNPRLVETWSPLVPDGVLGIEHSASPVLRRGTVCRRTFVLHQHSVLSKICARLIYFFHSFQ